MHRVTSADGTRIAYDRYGDGPAVILIGGALSYRTFKTSEQTAKALAEHCTVLSYDRRGRGDSGDGDGHMSDAGRIWSQDRDCPQACLPGARRRAPERDVARTPGPDPQRLAKRDRAGAR
jgi:pimeloyl-ACP methyl ester carboxylesterase